MKALYSLLFLSVFLLFDATLACKTKCTLDPLLTKCSANIDYVCVFFKKNPSDKFFSQMEVINACQACIRPGARFNHLYEAGGCKAKKVYCDDGFRPEVCTKEYNPVCAYSLNGKTNKLVRNTSGNKCTACADPSVQYYVKGACQ